MGNPCFAVDKVFERATQKTQGEMGAVERLFLLRGDGLNGGGMRRRKGKMRKELGRKEEERNEKETQGTGLWKDTSVYQVTVPMLLETSTLHE